MGPTPPKSLKIIAHIQAKPTKRDELEKVLLSLIEPTRSDEGYQEYELFISQDDPCHFTFVETWESLEALEKHLQTPHLQGFLSRADELLDGAPQVLKLSRLG
ncbi:MAG TPA: putative quinol monooxygenase [bacterium]|nr:putative quinol monooxygenase [bacterium]